MPTSPSMPKVCNPSANSLTSPDSSNRRLLAGEHPKAVRSTAPYENNYDPRRVPLRRSRSAPPIDKTTKRPNDQATKRRNDQPRFQNPPTPLVNPPHPPSERNHWNGYRRPHSPSSAGSRPSPLNRRTSCSLASCCF